jgi:hypothetical protein
MRQLTPGRAGVAGFRDEEAEDDRKQREDTRQPNSAYAQRRPHFRSAGTVTQQPQYSVKPLMTYLLVRDIAWCNVFPAGNDRQGARVLICASLSALLAMEFFGRRIHASVRPRIGPSKLLHPD